MAHYHWIDKRVFPPLSASSATLLRVSYKPAPALKLFPLQLTSSQASLIPKVFPMLCVLATCASWE